jgi:hypothetical protein
MAWGRGDDAVEAINNWKKNAGLIRGSITIKMRFCDEKAYVDDFGTLSFNRCEKLPDVTITEKQANEIWYGIEILNELCYPVDDAIDEVTIKERAE